MSSDVTPNRAGFACTMFTGSLATLVLGAAFTCSEMTPAWAQQAFVAAVSDKPGETSQMFVLPAFPGRFDALLRPEFSRRDVPLFREHLHLDETQMYVLEVLIDSYTEQFQAAVDDFRAVQRRYHFEIPGLDPALLDDASEGALLGSVFNFHDDEGGSPIFDIGAMAFDLDLGGPGQVSINVTNSITVSDDGSGSGAPVAVEGEPAVIVAIDMQDENGESILSEEQMKEITDRISEQIKERLAEVEAKRQALVAERTAAAAAAAEGDPNAQDSEPAATAEEVAQAGRALIAERNRLRDELETDVTLLLNEEQKIHWPEFERTHRRISTMRAGEFAGESVDLVRIVNQLQPKIEDKAKFEAARLHYELALEEALQKRNAMLPEHEIDLLLAIDRMMKSEGGDDETYLKLMDRMADARAAVRDANLDAADVLEPLLAADDRAAFREAVRREAYPFIYRGSQTRQCLNAALEFEELTTETRDAIAQLKADFDARNQAINERWEKLTRAEEPRRHRTMMESMSKVQEVTAPGEDGAPPPMEFNMEGDATMKLMEERRSLNRTVMDQLCNMLTEEQVERLPRRRMPTLRRVVGEGGKFEPVRVIRTESTESAETKPD